MECTTTYTGGVLEGGHDVKDLIINGSKVELKLESIALGLNSNETQIGRPCPWIEMGWDMDFTRIGRPCLGLNSNVTQVSSSLGSLYRSKFIFGCKRINGPTKQPKKF